MGETFRCSFCWCVLDSSGSEQVPLDVCCEHGTQTSVAVKSGDDVHYLSAYPGSQVAVATKFSKLAPNVCGFLVWNFLHFTIMTPRILRLLPDFKNLFTPELHVVTVGIYVVCLVIKRAHSEIETLAHPTPFLYPGLSGFVIGSRS